jgi:hypothetical protein
LSQSWLRWSESYSATPAVALKPLPSINMFDHDSRSRSFREDPAYTELIRSGAIKPPPADIGETFGYSAPMPPPMKPKRPGKRRKPRGRK